MTNYNRKKILSTYLVSGLDDAVATKSITKQLEDADEIERRDDALIWSPDLIPKNDPTYTYLIPQSL